MEYLRQLPFLMNIKLKLSGNPEQDFKLRLFYKLNSAVLIVVLVILFFQLVGKDWLGASIGLAVATLIGFGLWLLISGKFVEGVFYLVGMYTILMFILVMLHGITLGGEFIFIAIAILSSVFFERMRHYYLTVGAIVLAYFITRFYFFVGEPKLADHVSGWTYHLLFLLSAAVGSWITIQFGEENRKHLRQVGELIKNLKLKNQELERNQKMILEANQQLEQINGELENFAHVISHDLKEPLRNIISFSGLTLSRMDKQASKEQLEYLEFINKNAKQLHAVVTSLKSFFEAEREGLPPLEVPLGDLLSSVVESLNNFLEERNAEVIYGALPSVQANYGQLFIVFKNLLENSVKYNRAESPQVEISYKESGNCHLFSVRDNGIGIEPAFQERIFEMFKRLHSRAEFEGTGLGLPICKKIIKQRGGEIWLEESSPQGSTFCFTIPKSKVIGRKS